MGILDIFKRRSAKQIVAKLYGGDWNYFVWNYAHNIYTIPEVRTAINTLAEIFSTVNIWNEVKNTDGTVIYKDDSTQEILALSPNPLQNKSQFYQNVVTQLLLENNAFIEPIFDENGELQSLYPLPYKNFKLSIDDRAMNGYVQFTSGAEYKKYNLKEIIYLSRFSTITGGEKNNLGLYETVIKSLEEHIVNYTSPNKPRAILQSENSGSGQLKASDRNGVQNSVAESFSNTVQGVAYFDKMWKITPINWNENEVNKELMQFIINIVYNYFRINENIINCKASEVEMAMFVKTTIKPLAEQFECEFNRKLFTKRERAFGRKIEFDWTPLLVTTWQAEANAAQIFMRNGILCIDEVRERLGYSALANGVGKIHRASADTVNVEVIDTYQLGKVDQTNNKKEVEVDNDGAEDRV